MASLGIPPQRHTIEGLAAYFPGDMDIRHVAHELEAIAEVLVHLVRIGIIRPRAEKSPG